MIEGVKESLIRQAKRMKGGDISQDHHYTKEILQRIKNTRGQ